MNDYISRGYMLEMIAERNRNTCDGKLSCLQMKHMVETAPAADVRPVVRAEWTTKRTEGHDGEWYCTNCDYEPQVYEASNYCPNCGAEMGGQDNG